MNVIQIDEGDREEYSIERAVTERTINAASLSLLAARQADIEQGELTGRVQHNEAVTERALEEDVFYARVYIPGWFINNDDELADHYGETHPGATVEVTGLVEDYSEKAFRIVAEELDTAPGDLVHEYAWNFVPKSVVTVTRVTGVSDRDDADEVTRRAHSADIRRTYEWVWEEGDEMPSLDAADYGAFVEADDLPDEAPRFSPGERVKGRFPQPTGWKAGRVIAVTPRHGGDDWSYHVHHSGHEPGEADTGASNLRSLEDEDDDDDELADGMLGVLQSAEREFDGDESDAVSETIDFAWRTYVAEYKISTHPTINDDGELTGVTPAHDEARAA